MFVVGKLDGELARVFRMAKGEAGLIARRNLHVTDGADGRPRAAKELLPMTTNAGIMAGIVCHVRERACRTPVRSGNFVAGVAGPLMIPGGVQEFPVVDRWPGRGRCAGAARSSSLSEGDEGNGESEPYQAD